MILQDIKKKKELSGIPDEVVLEALEKTKKTLGITSNISKKDERILIKETRALLRNYVGRFKNKKSLEKLLDKGKIKEILLSHSSTRERIEFYPKLNNIIKKLNPKSILDLGCGLNPLAIAKNYEYYASDIDSNNLNLIKKYFQKNNIKGNVFTSDLRKERNFPNSDLCLIFKVLDILKMPHKEIEALISSIKSKNLIVSFSTITLSGKPMREYRRFWFERILQKKQRSFKIVKSENEIFYIIQQENQ